MCTLDPQSRGSSSMSAVVWRKTAEFHLKDSDSEPSVAAQALEELLKMEPNNLATQAQLVLAYAKFDLAKALAVSKKLPKFSYQVRSLPQFYSVDFSLSRIGVQKSVCFNKRTIKVCISGS